MPLSANMYCVCMCVLVYYGPKFNSLYHKNLINVSNMCEGARWLKNKMTIEKWKYNLSHHHVYPM